MKSKFRFLSPVIKSIKAKIVKCFLIGYIFLLLDNLAGYLLDFFNFDPLLLGKIIAPHTAVKLKHRVKILDVDIDKVFCNYTVF